MKNFLKVFIIVILVLGAVGGTCYFFFRNIEEKNNTTVSLASEHYSESKFKFDQSLLNVSYDVNSDGTDNRLDLLVQTSENIDDIVEVLISYYIKNDTKINSEKISKSLKQVKASRSLLNSMVSEYNIKKSSPFFDRHAGANDLYEEFCNYLVTYARFASLINGNLDVNKNVDLKYNMFDVYSNVVMNTFNQRKTVNSRVTINNDANINLVNEVFEIKNGLIKTNIASFAIEVNYFNKFYNDCNKIEFATNLSLNVAIATNANQSTNEKVASYYFKQIFGI